MSCFYSTAVKLAREIVADIIKIYVHDINLKHGIWISTAR